MIEDQNISLENVNTNTNNKNNEINEDNNIDANIDTAISKLSSQGQDTSKNIKLQSQMLIPKVNQSWDFTPIPEFLKVDEKKRIINRMTKPNLNPFKRSAKQINDINLIIKKNKNKTLNYDFIGSSLDSPKKTLPYNPNPEIKDPLLVPNHLYLNVPYRYNVLLSCEKHMEIPGDFTKSRAPAYSFGKAREDCKLPNSMVEKIFPCPGSYNITDFISINSRNKKGLIKGKTNKKFSKDYQPNYVPGPGSHTYKLLDIANNGNYPLSTYNNSPYSCFGKFKSIREKVYGEGSDWNIKPEPGTYNVNENCTMFKKDGKFPLSQFPNGSIRSFMKERDKRGSSESSLEVKGCLGNVLKKYCAPGDYNHYSQFFGYRYNRNNE